MLKNISALQHKIGDRLYTFLCDNQSPLSEIKETMFEFLKYVGQVEDAVKAQQAKASSEVVTTEPVQE